MKDRSAIRQLQRDDANTTRRLYETYRDDLLILAVALSHDAHLAEDAVQDAFVAFTEKQRTIRIRRSLKGYLSAMVANRIRDLLRAKRTRDSSSLPQSQCRIDATDPGQIIAWNEQLERLSAALGKLPYEQREVIVLRIHGQMKFRVIARHLGISANTAKGRYRYGLEKLRAILNGEPE